MQLYAYYTNNVPGIVLSVYKLGYGQNEWGMIRFLPGQGIFHSSSGQSGSGSVTQPPFQCVAGDEVARSTVEVLNVWNDNYPNLTKPCQNMQADAE
jgi:hypothetical protein